MTDLHLSKKFSKPREGEYVPITFIEFTREFVGWSPELKRSMYITREGERKQLKRVRQVNVMMAINHLSGKVSSIELTDEERAQFEEVYRVYLERGGQIRYTRKKSGARTIAFFELQFPEKKSDETVEKRLLSERM